MKYKGILFLTLGIVFSLYALLVNGASIAVGEFPQMPMLFALAIMSFCLAYLTPHFAAKDERAQLIRQRAIYISYFWGVSFALMLMIAFNPTSPLTMTAFQVLSLFMALYISAVFLNMVYYAKKY